MDRGKHSILYSWRFWLFVLSIFICIGICVSLVPVQRADGIIKLSSTSSQNPNQHSEPAGNAGTGSNSTPAIVQPANSIGKSCNTSGVLIIPSKDQPDQHIFSASFEILPPDNSTLYASASFFPNNDAVYDMVQYVDKSCEELEKTVFKNLKRKSVLKKNIILLDSGAVKVFLMPAGRGTVVIKKEIVK